MYKNDLNVAWSLLSIVVSIINKYDYFDGFWSVCVDERTR